MPGNDSALRAGPREWLGLAVLTLPILLIAMDNTVLVDATAVAERLTGASGAQVLSTAREAFTDGLTVVSVTRAVLSVALAAAVVALLRGVRPGPQPEDAGNTDKAGA